MNQTQTFLILERKMGSRLSTRRRHARQRHMQCQSLAMNLFLECMEEARLDHTMGQWANECESFHINKKGVYSLFFIVQPPLYYLREGETEIEIFLDLVNDPARKDMTPKELKENIFSGKLCKSKTYDSEEIKRKFVAHIDDLDAQHPGMIERV